MKKETKPFIASRGGRIAYISGYLFLTLLVIALVLTTPVLLIWSLNTLFNLEIVYSLKTWVAAAILVTIIAGRNVKQRPIKTE